jgi:hypothetical protein
MLNTIKYLWTLLTLWLKNIHVKAYRDVSSDDIIPMVVVYNLLLAVPTLLVLLTTVPSLNITYILLCMFLTVLITSIAAPIIAIPVVLFVNKEQVAQDIRVMYNTLKKEADNYIKENK